MQPVPAPKAVGVEPTSAEENLIRCDCRKCAWPAVVLPLETTAFWICARYQPTRWLDLVINAPKFQSASERPGLLAPLRGVRQWSATGERARLPAREALRREW